MFAAHRKKENMCQRSFSGSSGMLVSDNYPRYNEKSNCSAHIEVETNSIIKAFVMDLAIE